MEFEGEDHLAWVGNSEGGARHDRRVRHRGSSRPRRIASRDGAVHRHRRFDPPRRRDSATFAGTTCSGGTRRWFASGARALRRPGGKDDRGRLPRDVRRPAGRSGAPSRYRRQPRARESRSVAGLHSGEVELIGDDIGGIAVHVAARICDLAAGGQVLDVGHGPRSRGGLGDRFRAGGIADAEGRRRPGPDLLRRGRCDRLTVSRHRLRRNVRHIVVSCPSIWAVAQSIRSGRPKRRKKSAVRRSSSGCSG